MSPIVASIVFSLILIVFLVSILLFAKAKLMPSGKVKITINGTKTIEVDAGGTLLSTLGNEKIFLPSACGGGGTCIQCECHVQSGGGEPLPTEVPNFSRKELAEGIRLSCQVKVKNDMEISIPEEIFGIKKWEATVVSNYNVATFIKEFIVELPGDMDYKALAQFYFQAKFKDNDFVFCDARFLDRPLLKQTHQIKNIFKRSLVVIVLYFEER